MKIGLGLPIADLESLLTWARRADAGPFSTLGLLDRLVYDNPEPLVTLAAIAGATSRIRVQTEVLLAPLRSTALLAKQSATLDRISGGRFTLGIGVGGRQDDHDAAGTDLHTRGRHLDSQMAVMRRIWAGEPYSAEVGPIGPAPFRPGGPEVLFGAFKQPALERVARWGDGFLGAAPLDFCGNLFRAVEESWQQAGRSGAPRLVAQVNVATESTVDETRKNIIAYYGEHAAYVVDRVLVTPSQIRSAIAAFGDLGADEVMLYCWSPDPDQVGRIADIVS
jgi:alkanesulfonate monooxygenase SsuD/methylene tetrahydromethanopterin reductase-like flavin-dependent oxidoreductase (luciferase family)